MNQIPAFHQIRKTHALPDHVTFALLAGVKAGVPWE